MGRKLVHNDTLGIPLPAAGHTRRERLCAEINWTQDAHIGEQEDVITVTGGFTDRVEKVCQGHSP